MDVVRALVVAILLATAGLSAQGPTPPAQTSGTLSATGSVPLNVSGYASVAFQLTGTFVATVTFEGSVDGTNYQAINVTPTNSSSATTTATSTGVWVGSVGGLKFARARVSAYTSGSVVISVQAAQSGGGSGGGGGGGSSPSGTIGAAVPATASPVAVKDNAGNLAYPLVDGSGNLLVAVTGAGSGGTSSVDGSTYTAGTTAGTPAMVARDDTSPTQLAEDKVGIPRGTAFRAMHVNFRNASGTEIGVAGNAIIVDGTGGTFPASQSGTWNINNVAGTVSLPTGAAIASKQPAFGTAGTSSADVLTVQGRASMTPLLVDPSGVTSPISAASLPLPTSAATSTKQSDGSQKTQIVDGSGNVIASTSNNLNVQCANCSGSGASAADEASFTAGTSTFAPSGGFFQTTATSNALTTGQQGMMQLTANRALFTNLRNASGTEIGTSTTPVQVTLANTGANTNKLLVTPDSVALPANQSVNVNQLAGTTTDTNSGTKSAGTLRVVLATDQPALTNKLLVTPDSVALPANQSVNVSQINAVTPLMGNGASGTGAQRVTIANDSTGILALTTGSAQIGHLEANQSTNIAQMNGVTVTMGAGATGTGVQRTNDVASSATGAAPPASAAFMAGLGSGATGGFLTGITVCDTHKPITITSATTTLMITGVSGRHVRICAIHLVTAIANNVAMLSGTGATCGTGTAGISGGTTAANGYNFAANGGLTIGSGFGEVMRTVATGDSVCIVTSAAGPLAGNISYAIY